MDRYMNKQNKVIVEAAQLMSNNAKELAEWSGSQVVQELDHILGIQMDALNVPTPAGRKRLSRGDYLVLFEGNFHLSKPTQFEAYYDRLTPRPIVTPVLPDPEVPREEKMLREGRFGKEPWMDGPMPEGNPDDMP